ncbi:MAG: coiled-coil domain-containing protein [Saprospiraceae bacterium]
MTRSAIVLVSFLFTTLTPLLAQFGPVQEVEKNMSFGMRPCFRLDIPGAEPRMVEDMWKEFARKNFNAKLKKDKKSGEWVANQLNSPIIGATPFSIYSAVEKSGKENAAINIWFDLGSGFLNRRDHARSADEMSRLLRQFYFDVRRVVINNEIKAEEDKLKALDARHKKLVKDLDALNKDIENYKARIKKAEEDIVKNQRDQESALKDMDNQRRTIEEVRVRLQNVEREQ